MAIGPTLQEARLDKQLTTSQVAEMTRMKVQIVDDLEHDDFHRIAAIIYGKGFIKLFAECVGLDPAPLIADYMRTVKGEQAEGSPVLDLSSVPPPSDDTEAMEETTPEPEPPPDDLFAFANSKRKRVSSETRHSEPDTVPAAPVQAPLQAETTHRTHSRQRAHPLEMLKPIASAVRQQAMVMTGKLKQWLAGLKWSDQFIKMLAIALAVIVALALLGLMARHLATRDTTRSLHDDELMFFTPPPEPYLD